MATELPDVPLSVIAQAITPPAPVVVNGVEFTPEEARRGRAMRGNTLIYCCYGMYCDAGHSSDCQFAPGVAPSHGGEQV